MGWIDDTEKRWQAERDRDARIEAHATEIYEALWAEVLADVNKANAIDRFSGLKTNGHQLAHVISFPMDNSSSVLSVPYGVSVELRKSEHQIVVSTRSDGADLCFDIDLCNGDGAVCLKMDDRKISYEEASRRILTAFLYPGLPYVAPVGSARDYFRTDGGSSNFLKAPRIPI